jgi:beta-glucanase (GH16 family)
MKSSLVLFSLCAFIALGACQNLNGWTMVWHDEFDGTTLNTSKWQAEVDCWGGGNGELQCYTNRPQNLRVQNGNLVLTAVPGRYTGSPNGCTNNNDNSCGFTKDFTSGRIRSINDPSGSFLRGRFEIRAIVPKGKHLWPAFWMLPTGNSYGAWAASGEIDILEMRGQEPNVVQSTLHYGAAWPNNVFDIVQQTDMGQDLSTGYHVYAAEWEEKEIRFYTDNRLVGTRNLDKSWCVPGKACPYSQNGQPWDKKMHILINLAIGGGFFNGYGTLSQSDVQAWVNPTYVIDYVRVYAKGAATTGAITTGTTGSGSTTGSNNNCCCNQASYSAEFSQHNAVGTINGASVVDADQVKMLYNIAVGCGVASVALLAAGVALIALVLKRQQEFMSRAL